MCSVKTLVYLIWNGHARDTSPSVLPGKRTKLPKQTTESKVYDYRINKGSSWQFGAIFLLRLETRILQCHPHWWETFLHFPLYHCPSNNLRDHKKNIKVQHRYHNTKNVIFIKTAAIRFHLNQSSSGGYLLTHVAVLIRDNVQRTCCIFSESHYPQV